MGTCMELSMLILLVVLPSSINSLVAASSSTAAVGGTGVHVPVGKDGEGLYTASTKGCFDVINTATPLILEQIEKQTIRPRTAFHIADYGTADAGTSLGLLGEMVRGVRRRSGGGGVDEQQTPKEVVIHYEDQLTNEWRSVFNHILGNKPVSDAYGRPVETPYKLGNVYAEACGVGFHEQCYASNSIDFGVSFTAMHWLSSFPASLVATPYMHAARYQQQQQQQATDQDSCEQLPEKEQASLDWKRILQARANELVPGGRFVCVNFCVSKEGYFLGQTDVGVSMWDSFQRSWDKLKEQNLIDEQERLGVSFPSYYRTTPEFLLGVDEIPNLKVVSMQEKIVRCPYRELYVAGQSGMKTAREYAEWFVPTTRTWSHSTFKSALRPDRTDKEEVMNQFWENYKQLVEQQPEQHGMDYVHAYIVLEKTE